MRDAIEGERVVQTAMCSLLKVAHGPYVVDHKIEAKRDSADISLVPQLVRYPGIGWAMLVERRPHEPEGGSSGKRKIDRHSVGERIYGVLWRRD